ncbi:hypothetical protein F4802DRAFT_593766 [Xylaria palmicola]|nr:hypothetical protein F4802DRAFT_593766 [Xylaria palmicola]
MALHIGPCFCSMARERYRTPSEEQIKWEWPWDRPTSVDIPTTYRLPAGWHSVEMTIGPLDLDQRIVTQPVGAGGGDDNDDDNDLDDDFDDASSIDDEMNSDDYDPTANSGGNDNDNANDNANANANANGNDASGRVPRIGKCRINLTALSQRYNMYAAAYGKAIHISRVRSCVDHALPAHPDLILEPPRSSEGKRVGGYISPMNKPHYMNHLIMGDLGLEEILLVACDDGDVIAYYNVHIERALSQLESGGVVRKPTSLKPFFHQNVGKSAWGLAIHKNSRLIAVSNNTPQVHVFVMALADNTPQASADFRPEPEPARALFQHIREDSGEECLQPSSGSIVPHNRNICIRNDGRRHCFPQRQFGYEIIRKAGRVGDNIPSVAFIDDASGYASKVVAIDLTGKLWYMPIWSTAHPYHSNGLHHVHKMSEMGGGHWQVDRGFHADPRGWCVLVLPESSFLPTDTFQESLGLSPAEAVYVKTATYECYIDTARSMLHVKNNSIQHPWWRHGKMSKFDYVLDGTRIGPYPRWYAARNHDFRDWNATRDVTTERGGRPLGPPHRWNIPDHNLDGSSIMRVYDMDIELLAHSADTCGIMCPGVTFQTEPADALQPKVDVPLQRLSNVLHVPELCLVVAGSGCGRVALVTLTRPTNPQYSFRRGFRVEAVLPRRSDEDRNLRPICPLLGVAVGPLVPGGGGGGGDEPGDRRRRRRLVDEPRYRIFLHYYDHRILAYEIYRDMKSGALSVI